VRRTSDLWGGASRLTAGALAPVVLLAALCAFCWLAPAAAIGAIAAPHWSIVSQAQPTFFNAGDGADAYRIVIRNDGAGPTAHASAVTLTDTLPAGVTATRITTRGEGPNGSGSPKYEMTCSGLPATTTVTCAYEEGPVHGAVLAGATIEVTITVSVPLGVDALEANSATVSGGGAPSATAAQAAIIRDEPVPFGLSYFATDVTDEAGDADTQAGSHPFELSASLAFNVSARETPSPANGEAESPLANASPRDLEVELPPGLVGDAGALPRCSQQAFQSQEALACPIDTQVGTIKPLFYGTFPSAVFPIFNVSPPAGQPLELGFSVAGIGHIPIFMRLRSDGDYGLTASLNAIPETGPLQGAILTLWGVPADPSHDLEREGTLGQGNQQSGEFCKPLVKVSGGVEEQTRCPSGAAARPFLTLPSMCQGDRLPVEALTDSWQRPGPPLQSFAAQPGAAEAITGCERLSLNPSLAVVPENDRAGAPSGYTIDLRVPQDEDPSALAAPDVRTAVVKLPAGVVVSPSGADGLRACSQRQFGLHSLATASCPAGSQIGTAKISTPLLSSPLEGQLFLGEPGCAPCTPTDAQRGRLLSLLVQVQDSGVAVKLAGSASIDQHSGQLTATFGETPELPLEEVRLTLNGGPRALLANPSTCASSLAATSWLTPYSGETPAQSSSEPFQMTDCPSAQFHPSFVAGTTQNRAGAFAAATVTLSRTDQDEALAGVTVRMPPGLLGMLSAVAPCSQSQAQAGTCAAQSRIGMATLGAGPGADPLFLGGSVYLTGPYEGAPFGLSITVPAIAGPLDLGTIEIGARIEVNPSTAALTIVSDPLPQSLDGIPLQLKTVNLTIDRQGFIFNPTDCQPLAIEGALQSALAATAVVSSPFQAADCAKLAFAPKLTALTHARTSKASGVYLHVKVVSGPGQANIAKLKVDLPKRLSARLTTLQGACTAAAFDADPASCPATSVVGRATAVTPVFTHALSGPVYIVSHADLALPELELVLEGENMVLHLAGQTSLKQGIASSAFQSLPDAPISTLDLVLESGPHSLLAANLPARARGRMCGYSLAMPTVITAQNGAVRRQSMRIAVSGCTRHKA
jgi:uncharacterized repeat protein (TIGR01451 family)